MKVRVGATTDIGQVREGNEDSYLVLEPLYAVADGMGGHRGGEVASSLALETVQGMFERREGSLAEQVAEANRAVFDRSQNDRERLGHGDDADRGPGRRQPGASRARGRLPRVPPARRRAHADHRGPHARPPHGDGGRDHRGGGRDPPAPEHPHAGARRRPDDPGRRGRHRGRLRRPAPAVHGRAHRHGPRGADPRDPARDPGPAGGGREARQGREPRRRHRQHHRGDPRLRGRRRRPGRDEGVRDPPAAHDGATDPAGGSPEPLRHHDRRRPDPGAAARGGVIVAPAARADVSHGSADAGAPDPSARVPGPAASGGRWGSGPA